MPRGGGASTARSQAGTALGTSTRSAPRRAGRRPPSSPPARIAPPPGISTRQWLLHITSLPCEITLPHATAYHAIVLPMTHAGMHALVSTAPSQTLGAALAFPQLMRAESGVPR